MSRTQLLLFASCIVVAIAALRGAYIDTLNVDDSDSWRYFSLYFPILHLSSFVFGMALGRIYLFGQSASNRMHNLMFLFGALILFLLFGARSSLPFWVLTDATLVPLYGLLILGGANLDSHLRTVFSAPVLVLLGESSYSIYILHSGIIFWLHWILQKLFTLRLDVTIDFLICIGFVIGISILSFKYFERPLRRWLLIRIARI